MPANNIFPTGIQTLKFYISMLITNLFPLGLSGRGNSYIIKSDDVSYIYIYICIYILYKGQYIYVYSIYIYIYRKLGLEIFGVT